MRKSLFHALTLLALLGPNLGDTEGQADGLWCYTCENERSLVNCVKFQKCAKRDSYCVKNITHANLDEYRISKGCSLHCTERQTDTASTYCCGHSFCNGSGTTMKTNCVLVGAGIMAAFIYVFPLCRLWLGIFLEICR